MSTRKGGKRYIALFVFRPPHVLHRVLGDTIQQNHLPHLDAGSCSISMKRNSLSVNSSLSSSLDHLQHQVKESETPQRKRNGCIIESISISYYYAKPSRNPIAQLSTSSSRSTKLKLHRLHNRPLPILPPHLLTTLPGLNPRHIPFPHDSFPRTGDLSSSSGMRHGVQGDA